VAFFIYGTQFAIIFIMKKKSAQKAKKDHAGVMRNDLPGFVRLRGERLSIRYKGKDIATGYKNTASGWNMLNEWWAIKSNELQAIEDGEKSAEDTILNIFNRFLDYKRKITKITKKTEQYYLTGFNAIITEPNLILSDANIRKQIDNYVRTATVSSNSVNIYLLSYICIR
jgi:hypothetical protein